MAKKEDGLDQSDDNLKEKDEEEQVSDDQEDDVDRYWPPPTQESVEITGSNYGKTISAFAFNNSGTRFAAGGHDFEVRIWDFQAMTKEMPQHINNVQPAGQTVIKQLKFSPDNELILVVSGSSQAVIIGKDGQAGKNRLTCPKGDQYIADMANTKGHVQILNDGDWNPKDKTKFLTCSNDATLRLWDISKLNQQKTVIKTRSPVNGLRTVPNVSKYSRDSLSIIAGCNDGSIMTWDTRRKFFSTSSCIKNAHFKGSEITGIDYSYSGDKICSRSEDETCKIWDLRKLKEPLASRAGLAILHTNTDCCFSPDDKHILTGTSSSKDDPGRLHFLNALDLTTQQSLDVEGSSVLRVRWHPKINHIGYSCTNGQFFIAYDKQKSMGGFMKANMGHGMKRKKYNQSGVYVTDTKRIIAPHALPVSRDDSSSSSNLKRSYKPELPASANEKGRVRSDGATLSSYIAKNLALAKKKDQQPKNN